MSNDPLAPLRTPEQPGPGPLSASSLRALELTVGRRVDGLLAGDYRSAFAGVGSELWQVRPYQPGDDVRRIEWNVTARTGEPHVRVELAERVLVTWLVLDASASMAFGTGDRRKADVAEGVAIAVGYAATRRGNRLGTIAFGAEPVVERPRQGRRALLDTLRLLRDLPPTGAGTLRDALELADRVTSSARSSSSCRTSAGRSTGGRRCCGSRAATPCSRSKCATRASRSSPTSASCGSSTRRRDGSCGSTPATVACASGSPRSRPTSAARSWRSLASAGVRHVALSTEGDWLRPLAGVPAPRRRAR